MPVHFLPAELSRWDEADDDALVLPFFEDERPLRGAAGLADWRLCGRLSRLLKAGKVAGQEGEALLLPPGRRLSFSRIVMLGLGASAGFDEAAYRAHARRIRDVLSRAGIGRYALQPPGRATGLIAPRRAVELWLEEEAAESRPARVSLIDTAGAHKELADILRMQERARELGASAGSGEAGAREPR